MRAVRNRTVNERVYATSPLERLAYVACGAAIAWSALSLAAWWYLSDAREHWDVWRWRLAPR